MTILIGLVAFCFKTEAAYHWIQNDTWTEGSSYNQVTTFEFCGSGVGDQVCVVLNIKEDCVIDKIGVLLNGVTANVEFHALFFDGSETLPNPGNQLRCPCGVNVPVVVGGPGFVIFDLADPQIQWQIHRRAGEKLVVCIMYMGDLGGSGDVNLDICADNSSVSTQTNIVKKCNPINSPWEFCSKYGLDHNLVIRAGWWVPDPTSAPAVAPTISPPNSSHPLNPQ